MTDIQTHRQTDRQTDRKTDRQTDRQPDRQPGRQTDMHTCVRVFVDLLCTIPYPAGLCQATEAEGHSEHQPSAGRGLTGLI